MKKHPLPARKKCFDNDTTPKDSIKRLYFDIETAFSLGAFWESRLYEVDIIKKVRGWFMLSFSYAWNDGEIKHKQLPDYKGYKKNPYNDKELVRDLLKLMNEADIIIGHNGRAFDWKKSLYKFVVHGFQPPPQNKIIDTMTIAGQLGFTSKSLENVAHDLGLGGKRKHSGFETWEKCVAGKMSAWKELKWYNNGDIVVLREVAKRFKPFIKNWDTIVLYKEGNPCTRCHKNNIWSRGERILSTGITHQRFQCQDCGKWLHSKIR